MARSPRRAREIEETRRHIVAVAARVFAREGFAAASMRMIAQEAGYCAASLYGYFPSKKSIFEALVESIVEEAKSLFDVRFPEGLTLRQRLELLLRHQNAWKERHRDAFLFLVGQGGLPSTDVPRVNVAQAHIEALTEWFERNAESELRRFSAAMAADVLWGLQTALFVRWIGRGAVGSLDDCLEDVLDVLFQGVLQEGARA